MDIDLNGLLVFRHLAQSGSFTETGRRWKISQPAVSLIIGRLESVAGLVLLERSNSGTRLTADGVLFLERANEVLRREFPELAARITLHLPDEKSKRHGQAVAAASLPSLVRR